MICYTMKLSHLFLTEALRRVFSRLGFEVEVHKDMTANDIRKVLESLGKQNFMMSDALVSNITYSISKCT